MKSAIILTVIAACIVGGSALTCYTCSACSSPVTSNPETCDSSAVSCSLTQATTSVLGLVTATVYNQGCSTTPVADCVTAGTVTGSLTSCYCGTDNCNGAAAIKGGVMLASLIAMVLAKLFA